MTTFDTYDTYGYDTSGYLKFILWSSVLSIFYYQYAENEAYNNSWFMC